MSSYPFSYNSPRFTLSAYQQAGSCEIYFHSNEITNTINLPETARILKKKLPTIFLNKCFNKNGLPFYLEVQQTQIGHLFEHILLESIYQQISEIGDKKSITGRTFWNWKETPVGFYQIMIKGNFNNQTFLKGLAKSIYLTELIITSSHQKEGQHVMLPLKHI